VFDWKKKFIIVCKFYNDTAGCTLQKQQYLLLFQCKNGSTRALQCYVTPALAILFISIIFKSSSVSFFHLFLGLPIFLVPYTVVGAVFWGGFVGFPFYKFSSCNVPCIQSYHWTHVNESSQICRSFFLSSVHKSLLFCIIKACILFNYWMFLSLSFLVCAHNIGVCVKLYSLNIITCTNNNILYRLFQLYVTLIECLSICHLVSGPKTLYAFTSILEYALNVIRHFRFPASLTQSSRYFRQYTRWISCSDFMNGPQMMLKGRIREFFMLHYEQCYAV